jgi:hypothetical protein
MKCWNDALMKMIASKKYTILISYGVSSFVTFARMQCLNLDVRRGIEQKPFPGIPYDVWVTLDSDMIFTPEQLMSLIDATAEYPVVSGLYTDAGGQNYMCVKEYNDYGHKFLDKETLASWSNTKYKTVDYVGLGFLAMRKEVLNAMTYPYFNRDMVSKTINGVTMCDQNGEDVDFCLNIKDAGYRIRIDTSLLIGHEKMIIVS